MPKSVSFDTTDHIFTTYSSEEYDRSYLSLITPCLTYTFNPGTGSNPLDDKLTMISPEVSPLKKRTKPSLSINTKNVTGPSFFTQLTTHHKDDDDYGYLIPVY
ncbi:hypothetical protein G6F56_008340 [Rhizopus delemar]|nr:hypothetical protein G6F56_008340 [Rhizopus delemar]